MQITDLAKEQALSPLLRQAFRPMFLFGAIFSVVAMALWGMTLNGWIQLSPYQNVMFWHQHEMIFGFVGAIIVGFLLTAVQNWTGMRATHGKALFSLTAVWLIGRLLMLFGGGLPPWFVALVDLSFFPFAAALFAGILINAGQQRNMFFVPVLLLFTVCNAIMHAGVLFGQFQYIHVGSTAAVWLVTLIMAIVSGRVLPMFTANGTQTPRVAPKPLLDKIALGSLWLIFVLHLFALVPRVPANLMAALFAFSGALLAWRWLRVKPWITLKVPLLWSLHISVGFIPLGLFLFALRYAGLISMSHSAGVHVLAAGAMGLMILAMMARVSLGHTGRLLQPKAIISVGFLLILFAALMRVFAGWALPGFAMHWYNTAILFWVVAYLLYVLVYFPVLTTPREDGRPG